MKTAEKLSNRFDLTLISTFYDVGSLSDYYGIESRFNHSRLGYGIEDNFLFEIVDRLVFSFLTYIKIILERPKIVYTRDIAFLTFLSLLPSNEKVMAFECHKLIDGNRKFPTFLQDFALKRADIIFCISEGVRSDVREKVIENDKIFLQRNCVDIEQYSGLERPDKPVQTTLTYIGSFKECKDVKTLLEAFDKLDSQEYSLKLVGLRNEQKLDLPADSQNIEIRGFLPQEEIIQEISESDILIYTSDKRLHQKRYTSPMKLFEYMASKRPVVAADLPTIREIAGDSIYYYESGDKDSLAEQIRSVTVQDNLDKASKAYEKVSTNYTWEDKAQFIEKKITDL